MDPEQAREISERDQLWASLRALKGDTDGLAAGGFDDSERQRQVVALLAGIVAAEIGFRARSTAPE